jgi:hypothetical protein
MIVGPSKFVQVRVRQEWLVFSILRLLDVSKELKVSV